jgi:hypothetical protein
MLLLIFEVDCKLLKTFISDKVEHNVTRAASADSDINIFVSAAFLTKAGRIKSI